MGEGGQTHTQTQRHINTMAWPGLGAGPSEEEKNSFTQVSPSALGLSIYTVFSPSLLQWET